MDGIVLSNKELVDGTVPSNKELVDGTVPSNSTILYKNTLQPNRRMPYPKVPSQRYTILINRNVHNWKYISFCFFRIPNNKIN